MKMPAWPKARHRPGAPDASRGDVWWRGAGGGWRPGPESWPLSDTRRGRQSLANRAPVTRREEGRAQHVTQQRPTLTGATFGPGESMSSDLGSSKCRWNAGENEH